MVRVVAILACFHLFLSLPLPLSPSLFLSPLSLPLLSLSQIRHLFSDFGVFISVVVWVVVDVLAQVSTPKLKVPNVFERGVYSTAVNRSFLIDPLGKQAV